MKTVSDTRNEFLNFFKGKGHEIVPSASLVPQNDPTLMFINSGMAQFKNVFTGKETRDYSRATSSQKCVRAGGKHNDLDNVGYTKRHHTFFEMLGNFSFGDYFREDAIHMAWELITKNFELDVSKLCVTVYHTDDEAFDIWKKITGFHDDKIIRIPTADNFWSMGDTGPCGPCTEIFYDHGDHIWGGPPGSADEDGDRFIEIWNLVFMQYEQIDADTRIELPNKCIDTGMGLERMAATLMGSNDNYAIDLVRAIIEHSADLTGVKADGDQSVSHRVIADHLRTAAFLIADGVMPSNEGRGYVLRRIMRRGMRHAHLLGAQDPLMHQLFPTLLGKMSEAYPELNQASALITETLRGEEERFKRTLDRGLKLLDEETADLTEGDSLDGATAFKLYDTFGFPLDLTQDALKAQGIAVDTDGFTAAMDEQKAKARAAWSGSGDAADDKIWFEILDECGGTEFLGYDSQKAEGEVLAIVQDGKRVDTVTAGDTAMVLTNQTPFYAESGGQVGDSGVLTNLSEQLPALSNIPSDTTLKSQRLTYKLIDQDDLQAVFDTLNYEHTAEIISFFSWPMTMDQAQGWVDRSKTGMKSGSDYCFIAYENEKPVGCIGLHPEGDSIEIGYWVAQPYQRQGLAQEMLVCASNFAFKNWPINTIWAVTNTGNEQSANTLLKQGFIYETQKQLETRGGPRLSDVYAMPRGITVTDTKKMLGKLYVHQVRVNSAQLNVGDAVEMTVDSTRRNNICANHSVTHLLHEALRRVLGEHVTQKGSAQDADRTRFDISHSKGISDDELAQVEAIVNDEITANTQVTTRVMPIEEARETGAMALFGEKYDDEVRVVIMGTQDSDDKKAFSVELCGGTHVKNTGDIETFKIISDSALSSGIRRLEALTGDRVAAYEAQKAQALQDAHNKVFADNIKLRDELAALGGSFEITPSVKDKAEHNVILQKENKKLQKEIDTMRRQQVTAQSADSSDDVKEIAGIKFTGRVLAGFPAKDLKPMADDLKAQIGSGVIVLIATDDGKASIVVGVTDDLTDTISAVDLVRVGSAALGGKGGGGRPDMAQAGGPNADAANDAVAAIEAQLAG